MLDGLLGRSFSGKCKSSIKAIQARIELIRRRRNAMQKFLKKDIADLLSNGLDINAYGRAEGLLVELCLSSCYDFIEQFCACVLKQLPTMQKQSACPEECREAVPSLMFAAARFADLPELRDLREIFTEKYGNSLEAFINQEFVDKLASKTPTKDKKLQLMQDIAKEFSINWDSRTFGQKMSNVPSSTQDQLKKHGSFCNGKQDGHRLCNDREDSVQKRDTQDVSSRGRKEVTYDEYKSHNKREETVLKSDKPEYLSHGRQELCGDGYKLPNGYKSHNAREDGLSKEDDQDGPSRGRRDNAFGQWIGEEELKVVKKDHTTASNSHNDLQNHSKSVGKAFKEEAENMRPFSNNIIPPPYVKPKDGKYGIKTDVHIASSDSNGCPLDFQSRNKDLSSNKLENAPTKAEAESERMNGHGDETKPKPRSVRRRRTKTPPVQENDGNFEVREVTGRIPSGGKGDDARLRHQTLFGYDQGQIDEEEKMDRLLIHYSKKQQPTYEEYELGRLREPKCPAHQLDANVGEPPHHRSGNGACLNLELNHPPARAVSLPPEPPSLTEIERVPARAASFESAKAGHVHPKLPDYDDLAARFATLRGR
ncbi:PREDICTED: uncharacterized protein LOC104592225 [Nelumbo nucifera]|uniref:Uncharacterized protein LOC104592225 n=1 Tax=Nelumbo nucifera TaxID=4432 RepID=A0A1U7ZEH0_NELNU|nr:PREDICTED: uncharacterized protein LOC104592225 [Nelumbo nucifera]